jgi:2C-methyl-D-erythritol 2,4-cyclodiphosphate synthase
MVLDRRLRVDIASQEDAALGKMRHFCAAILKKLAPPLLKEIESSALLRHDVGLVTPRRVTRANAGVPACGTAPRRSKKVSAAEAVLLKALGISQSDLEVNEEAIEEF